MLRALLYIPWKLWTLFPDSLRRRTYLYIAKNWGITHIWNVTRLPFGLALKRTHNRSPDIEANSIRFVRRNTTIPVPDVLDTVPPDGKNNSGLLLTSWIEGETLSSWIQRHLLWPAGFQKNADVILYSDSLEEQADALANLKTMFPEVNVPDDHTLLVELRDALTQIRSLPAPLSGPQICNINGGPTIWARCRDRCLLPPVNTIAEFHELLFQQVSWTSRLERLRLIAKPVHTRDYRITFTHSDLNPSNILVKDDHIVAVIDWEFAGWYPEYWEYTQLVMQNLHLRPREELWKRVGFFSGQYTEELKLERALWHSTGDMSIAPGIIPNDYLDQPM
ncbi:kinase-like domain-containing protein [Lentinula guzmanii]|uniref:Kinase-like domain-containing protein n=1 Tax=Lentinula guzmanii TaxID=2804957 RepID=A0AA38N5R0_9AGAR|nr:kinase-like domain-containing protein [Lentinula guzmanii]